MSLTLSTSIVAGNTGHISDTNIVHQATNGLIFSASAFYIPATSVSDSTAGHLMLAHARGATSGVASLDGNTLLPAAQLPTVTVRADQQNTVSPIVGLALAAFLNAVPAASLTLRGSRGTASAPVAILSGDYVAALFGTGQFSTTAGDYGGGASIKFKATENFAGTAGGSATNAGTQILFVVTANGVGSTGTVALTLDQDASATFSGAMTVAGLATFSSGIVASNTILTDGSVNTLPNALVDIRSGSAPTFTFTRDSGALVTSGAALASLLFRGATDGAHTLITGATIRGMADSAFSAGNAPTRLEFLTCAVATLGVRAFIDSVGKFWIGPNAAGGVASIDQTGKILSLATTGGIGYGTGAGGTVTQGTSKTTGVTLNTPVGEIVMNAAAQASTVVVSFVVTNSTIGANDGIDVWIKSGGTVAAYTPWVSAVAAGSFTVSVRNTTGGSLSEAPIVGFARIAGAVT